MKINRRNLIAIGFSTVIFMLFVSTDAVSSQSTCHGTTSNGSLENGQELPASGPNFETYSTLARTVGRTYVHSSVKKIVIYSYKNLEAEQPNKKYKYAETGFKNGGKFNPHKTHRNGLSVDFMTPVTNLQGVSDYFPTTVLNRFGYDVEFDHAGKFKSYTIDYDALGAHIVALHREAKLQGYDLWRVIFDPKLQPKLYKTKYSEYLEKNINFSKKKSWVRHDEHYHVDFLVPCK